MMAEAKVITGWRIPGMEVALVKETIAHDTTSISADAPTSPISIKTSLNRFGPIALIFLLLATYGNASLHIPVFDTDSSHFVLNV